MTEQLADLTTHHIEGITREGNLVFSCPLFSQISENLWMGGCPRGDAPQFDTIIDLYDREPYHVHPNQVRVSCRMLDSHELPEPALLNQLVLTMPMAVDRGPTLVHCQAGWNRSGLLTALYLIANGATPKDAIELLRKRRSPAVLCNKAFEALLLKQRPGHILKVAATSQ